MANCKIKNIFAWLQRRSLCSKKIAYSPLTNLLPVESNVPINVCFYYILKCSNGEVRPHEGYLRFINLQECTSKTKKEISLWRIRNIFFLFVLHLWITMCVSSSTSMSACCNIKDFLSQYQIHRWILKKGLNYYSYFHIFYSYYLLVLRCWLYIWHISNSIILFTNH